jgi:hypothetical protein
MPSTHTDAELLDAFEHRTLPSEQWTHRAHVRIAYIYLDRLPFDDALDRIRAGIKAYNAANNVPEGPTSGYNETTTRAFLHIVAAVKSAYADAFPVQNSDAFCETHPQLMSKHILRLFYSPQRRLHPDAKASFVEPDLAPLPRRDHVR